MLVKLPGAVQVRYFEYSIDSEGLKVPAVETVRAVESRSIMLKSMKMAAKMLDHLLVVETLELMLANRSTTLG